jgi:hypothetical protein
MNNSGIERQVRRAAGDAEASLSEADHAVRAFVSERPFAAVALAVAAGYVLARSINAIR